MLSYLKNGKQRVQIKNFSATKMSLMGSTRVNRPLLFNLFNQVKDTLATDYRMVTNWFYENVMVLNSKKCRFICIGKDLENETFTFEGAC